MNQSLSADERFAITDLLTRYATALDRRDFDLFRDCFTTDCAIDYGVIGAWQGVDAFTTFMEEVHSRCGASLQGAGM